jgi:hypothetical protein
VSTTARGGTFIRFRAGTTGMSARHVGYITRDRAVLEEEHGIMLYNLPDRIELIFGVTRRVHRHVWVFRWAVQLAFGPSGYLAPASHQHTLSTSRDAGMRTPLPDTLTRADLLQAIADLGTGTSHPFAPSTGYDVLHDGRRYPPKAVVGLATTRRTGRQWGPYDSSGGRGSKCFRILEANGFTIVTKADTQPYPDEIEPGTYTEAPPRRWWSTGTSATPRLGQSA